MFNYWGFNMPAVLFLKASGAPRKFANMPGYVKIKGHWVRANKEVKAPAGAPKAAHPLAHPTGKKYEMPEEHAKQLMYPEEKAASNHEMKNFNQKHVPNLLAHAKEGDVTAILGHKYGTNTHAKKLVAIANHLLEQMGSTHTVSVGQQAGAHEAISKHPGHETGEATAEAQNTPQEAAGEPEKAQAVEAIDQVADALKEPVAETEKPAPAEHGLTMPEFLSGKQAKGVRTHYESMGNQIMDAVAAKDMAALQGLVNPNAGAWKGKTANSKKLLGLYGEALAKLQQQGEHITPVSDEPTAVAAVETIAQIPAQPKPQRKANTAGVSDMDWDSFKTPDNIKSSKGYNNQLEAVKQAAIAGDVNAILAAKYGTNTYAKKVAAAANLALSKLGYPNVKVVLGKEAVHPMLDKLPQPSADALETQAMAEEVIAKKEEGPAEGETRQGKSGNMLVFHDGHWHNQETNEPVSEAEANPKFKEGQQLAPNDIIHLPAGTVIQTYDKDGKSFKQFILGTGCAWLYKNGKQYKNPIPAGHYKSLVGISGEQNADYTNGYHANQHPTTILKVAPKVWLSDKQKATLKGLYPGALSLKKPGVYPIMDGYMMLVTSLENPQKGFGVNEMGEWYPIQNVLNAYKDPDYQKLLAGEDPGTDLSVKLGLAPDVSGELPEQPTHSDKDIQQGLGWIDMAMKNEAWSVADDDISMVAAALKEMKDGSDESLAVMQWLVHAKSIVHAQAGAAVPEIPPAPAPEVVKAKFNPMPDFSDPYEFNKWASSEAGINWVEEGITYYGGENEFAESHAGKLYDTWAEMHLDQLKVDKEAKEKAEAREKAKAAKEAEAKESANDVDMDLLAQLLNAPSKPMMPKLSEGEESWVDALDDVTKQGEKGDIEGLKKQVDGSAIFGSAGGVKFHTYAKDMLKWAQYQKENDTGPNEGDLKQGATGMLVFHNGHWVLQGKPVTKEEYTSFEEDMLFSKSKDEVIDKALAFVSAHKNGPEAIDKMNLAIQTYSNYPEVVDQLKNVVKPVTEEQDKMAAAMPTIGGLTKPQLTATWQEAADKVESWLKHPDYEDAPAAVQDVISTLTGLQSPGAVKALKYAQDALAVIQKHQGIMPEAPAGMTQTQKDQMIDSIDYQNTSTSKMNKALELTGQYGTHDAYATAVTLLYSEGLSYGALKVGYQGLDNNILGPNIPPLPTNLSVFEKNYTDQAAVWGSYLPPAKAAEKLSLILEELGKAESPSSEATTYVQSVLTAVNGSPAPVKAQEDEWKEGDVKPGKGGLLMLKDGHWVLIGPDEVPIPDAVPGSPHEKMIKGIHAAFVNDGKGAVKSLHLTNHKNGTYSLSVNGVSAKKLDPHSAKKNLADIAQYLEKMKLSVGLKVANPSFIKTPAAVAPEAAKKMLTPTPSGEIHNGPVPIDGIWKQTGGQLGSNDGGSFTDDKGQQWYVKFPKDEDHAKAEILAARLYEAMGIAGQNSRLVTKDGKLGIASKWVDGLNAVSASNLATNEGVLDGFAADCWLGNWDVVGATNDNLKLDATGHAYRIDAGGSLMYRAQGSKKDASDWTANVSEIDTMRSASKNAQANAVFGKMTDSDVAASVYRVANLSNNAIRQIVETNAPGTAKERKALADLLIARKKDLIKRFPMAEDKPMLETHFNVQNLSVPPNFHNWNGTGKGLSSKDFINSSNQEAVNEVYSAAKKGDVDAIKHATAPVYDKESGEVVAQQELKDHPSQYVTAYWKDMVNEVNNQLNPPEAHSVGQVVTGDDLAEIAAKMKPFEAGAGISEVETEQQIGYYVMLGKVAHIEDHTPAKSDAAISASSWKQTAKDHWAKASAAAKASFSSYLGTTSCGQINTAIRTGKLNTIVQGKSVAQHIKDMEELMIPIPEGSTFVRNMGESGYGTKPVPGAIKALQQFLTDSEPGTVLQEPAFSSTSWTGGNSVLSNNDIQWNFTAGKGVKMFPAWLTANQGEGEGVLPPNARYVITGVKKVGKTVKVEAIIMPSDY